MVAENVRALAPRSDVLPNRGDWQIMREMAEALHESGLLPSWIKNPMAALAVIEKGKELGLQPMYALSRISMIEGKPCCDAEGMAAMIYRDHGPNAIRFIETTEDHCTVEYCRSGGAPARLTFSIEDARRANLLGKQNWKNYPQAMLRARAISAAARMAFPDTIGGLYTPEELGAEVDLNEHGEMTVLDVTPVSPIEPTSEEQDRAEQTVKTTPPTVEFAPFAYSDEERAEAIATYSRIAKLAVARKHKQADKIASEDPSQLVDGELKSKVDYLQRWEASLKPRPPVDPTNGDDDRPF